MTDFTKPEHTAHRFHNSQWLNPITLPLFGLADVATGLVTGRKSKRGAYSATGDNDKERLIKESEMGGMFGSESSLDEEEPNASSSDEREEPSRHNWDEGGDSPKSVKKIQEETWEKDRKTYYTIYLKKKYVGDEMQFQPETMPSIEKIAEEYPDLENWVQKINAKTITWA